MISKKPISFDDTESTEEVDTMPATKGAPEVEMAEASEVEAPAGETATLSLDMLGGKSVNPGDTVSLEVVEVSPDDGTVTVKYRNPKTGGIAKASAAFNEGV